MHREVPEVATDGLLSDRTQTTISKLRLPPRIES